VLPPVWCPCGQSTDCSYAFVTFRSDFRKTASASDWVPNVRSMAAGRLGEQDHGVDLLMDWVELLLEPLGKLGLSVRGQPSLRLPHQRAHPSLDALNLSLIPGELVAQHLLGTATAGPDAF
jgi:hypothetical protein